MKLANPTKIPRKLKKQVIKTWGRNTYKAIMKGEIIIMPYIIKCTTPIIADSDIELNNLIKSRYAKTQVNPNFYQTIK